MPFRIGIVGCGAISHQYSQTLSSQPGLEIVACADLMTDRATEHAAKYGIGRSGTPEELIADPDIDLVVNLTIPKAHVSVSRAALEAGKHVWSEKPLALDPEQGRELVQLASDRGLALGCAPDTFLGPGVQSCRALLDEGAIGQPVGAAATLLCPGHESWHPNPAFYYETGGGPMFDMGPYYVTALVAMLGPVKRVAGSTKATYPQRTITSEPFSGTVVDVEVPTHYAGVIDFVGGATATIVTSFDTWATTVPPIEVHGAEGTIVVPDPNAFDGPVRVFRASTREWTEAPRTSGHPDTGRGLGVLDIHDAIRTGRKPRASGELALHVLEVMSAFEESSRTGRHVTLSGCPDRPEPLDAPIG